MEITDRIHIPEDELHLSFARSGGPGGQNVNKVSSKVLLRWNPGLSPSLPSDVKARLLARYRRKLTKEGDLLISSQKTRDQAKNIDDCRDKLRELVREVAEPPKVRRPSHPTQASRRRRVQDKRRRAETKAGRRRPTVE